MRTRGTAFDKVRKTRSGIKRRVGILENKKVSPCKGMEDERSGAGDQRFFRTSPSSSEQMLDPQASTSMEPPKAGTVANLPKHTYTVHSLSCSYMCVGTEPSSIPPYCITRSCSWVNAQ